MKLGPLERLYINSPFRRRVQRPWEFHLFERIAPLPQQARMLELGCGNGGGLAYLHQHYAPASLTGIDLDPAQIALARSTLAHLSEPAALHVGSAERIPLPAQTCDIVFSGGCLHHVPHWQQAVAEVRRLLQPGGRFYLLEFYRPFLEFPLIRYTLPHPPQRFTHAELLTELTRQGFEILGTLPTPTSWQGRLFGQLGGITVARLTDTSPDYD